MKDEEIRQLQTQLGPDCQLMETHISWVLLQGELAWKIKKPVRFAFLDFSTPALRRHFCERELELNRRFSPDIYLGLSEIRLKDRCFRLDTPGGRLVDHAVRMRRLDQARRMDILVRAGKVGPEDMIRLAEVLAAFHRDAMVCTDGHDATRLEREFRDIESVIPWLAGLLGADTGRRLRASLDLAANAIHALAPRLERRLAMGFTRDGHGDLHCRNIFLDGEPRLFDCLEFDDRLRQVDLLAEIAFLGADLQSLGREDLWQAFLDAYQAMIPVLSDEPDQALLRWYLWYRANVRLKICCLDMSQHPAPDPAILHAALQGYEHYARDHSQRGQGR